MDEYDKKFAEMQKYIPFLEAMIERLQNSVKDKDSQTREIQLQKMESLHGILSNSRRKYVEWKFILDYNGTQNQLISDFNILWILKYR